MDQENRGRNQNTLSHSNLNEMECFQSLNRRETFKEHVGTRIMQFRAQMIPENHKIQRLLQWFREEQFLEFLGFLSNKHQSTSML